MSDADLEQIRKARLAQLQQQQQQGGISGLGGLGGGGAGQSTNEDEQRSAEASARSSLLAQILTPSAGDRLSRIRMVKESRATDVENRLIMLARSGQLRGRVDEEQLKGLLEAMSKQEQQQLGQGQLGGGGDVGGGGGGGYRVVRRAKDWDDEEGEEELDRVLGRG